jgi:NAD(P)-dependent dehydrogenase (short-subunit alcohol dehydrogenase family)
MLLNFQNQVAVITGGARGIGAAAAKAFLLQGAKVAMLDLNSEECEKYARALDPTGNNVAAYQADVTDEAQIQAAVGRIMERFGRIDILVNIAGILHHVPIDEKTVTDFERIVKVNLTGAFILCKTVVPFMKKQGRGKIVNMASLGGRTGRPGVAVDYSASKAGLVGLTQTLARELGPSGIYVNAIAPGPILTELTKQVPPEVFAKWNVGRAVNKDGLPEDIANAVLFLASGMSDWITGITLDVNGGIFIPN